MPKGSTNGTTAVQHKLIADLRTLNHQLTVARCSKNDFAVIAAVYPDNVATLLRRFADSLAPKGQPIRLSQSTQQAIRDTAIRAINLMEDGLNNPLYATSRTQQLYRLTDVLHNYPKSIKAAVLDYLDDTPQRTRMTVLKKLGLITPSAR